MNIPPISTSAQNLTQAQSQTRGSAPAAGAPQGGTAPIEQRNSAAPQAVSQSQNVQKNVNATQGQNELQQLQDAAQKISTHLNLKNSALEFSVDQASGRNVVKIVDKTTKEVVRQIPSEEAIHIAEALDELDEIRQGLLLSIKG